MSGPPYPHPNPVPGSNAIGSFQIGVSPIGTIRSFDFWKTIISQYANSTVLTKLIENFADYVDQTKNLDSFFDLIWNVDTAQGIGLDIWGRIVGVNRVLKIVDVKYFGFAEAVPSVDAFGFASFYSGDALTSNYALSDDAYRVLIFAKALANISDGSIPSINRLLTGLFPNRGNCYVTDGGSRPDDGPVFGFAEAVGDGKIESFGQAPFYPSSLINNMTMTYTFEFVLSPVEEAIVVQSGVMPKPVGVAATVVQI